MKIRRILAVLVCVMIVASLSVTAFAASTTFFTRTVYGYSCTGRGSFSGTTATSTLSATPVSSQANIPSEDCTAETWVAAWDSTGAYLGSEHVISTTNAKATLVTDRTVAKIGCGFTFTGTHFGYFYAT